MRVAVKNTSGVFIHSTTPRKARILLKEKKAVIESNNPFTIRLLFSESECGLNDSKSLNKFNSGILSEKDNNMCDNRKETEELNNDYGNYIQPSLNVIMANPNNKRIKWCSKDSNSANGDNSPESFAQTLYDACTMLYQQTDGNYSGNFVYIGKRGFELLQKLDPKRFWKMDNWIGLDYAIKVHYITTMPKNNFIVCINNKYFKERDKFIVGSIEDEECSEKSKSEEAIEQQKQSDNNKSEKENIMNNELHIPKTHLIFGYYGCGKTTYIRQLIKDKIQNNLGVCVLTDTYSAKTYFNKEDKNLHTFTMADVLTFLSDNEKNPTNIAKSIVNCFVANVGRFNIDTIAVDGMDTVFYSINSDYSENEYFRELSKCCKENKFNLLYTKGIDKNENDSSYHKIPTVFERFSDIITVLK